MKAVYFLVIVLLLASCQKDDECTKSVSSSVWTSLNQVQLQSDIAAIDAYLFAHSITAMEHESGLRYVITQNGVGSPPSCLEKTVSVTYSGKLLTTGVEFDFSTTPISFPLNKLIAGWKIGIP